MIGVEIIHSALSTVGSLCSLYFNAIDYGASVLLVVGQCQISLDGSVAMNISMVV